MTLPSRPAPHRRPGPSRSEVSAAVAAPNATLPSCHPAGHPRDTVVLTGGNARGTFDQPKTTIPVGINPVAIAAGKFRNPAGDDRDDMAVANIGASVANPGSLMVLLAQPDGSYAPLDFGGQDFVPVGKHPTAVAAGHFGAHAFVAVGNRTGVANPNEPTLSVFVQDDRFNFTAEPELPVPPNPAIPADPDVRNQDVYVAAIDFSGQGAPGEIAIAYQLSGDLVVLRRNDNAPGHFDRRDFSLAGITQAVAITAVRLPSSTADSIVVLGKDAADAAKVFIIESRGGAQPDRRFPFPCTRERVRLQSPPPTQLQKSP